MSFPAEALDVGGLLAAEAPEAARSGAGGCVYDLAGVVNHMGSLNGGHYTADCRSRDDGQWRCFNDSHVRVTGGPRSLSPSSAYVLFYVRRE